MNSPYPPRPASSSYRWVVCGLLLAAMTLNYLDRQVISYLKEFFCAPPAEGGFGWSNTDFSYLTSFFTAFYAGMTLVAGWIIDKIGTKLGLAICLAAWSLFGVANAFVGRHLTLHIIVRSAFGAGEAGSFPASVKTIAEWFPKRANAHWPRGYSTAARISARLSPRCSCPGAWSITPTSRSPSSAARWKAGSWPISIPARPGSRG